MALYDPITVGQRAAYYSPSFRGASFSQLLDWVHQSRLRNGAILEKYSGGSSSSWDGGSEYYWALYESAGILLAAQNEIILAFVDQHYRPQACDEGPDEEATDVDGVGAVTSRDVRICVVDINSVLDDHYDMYVIVEGGEQHPCQLAVAL